MGIPSVSAKLSNVSGVMVSLTIDATLQDLKNYLTNNPDPQYALAHRVFDACDAVIKQTEQTISRVITKE